MDALVPAVLVEMTIDNTQGQQSRKAYFGYQGNDPYSAMRIIGGPEGGALTGVGQGRLTAILAPSGYVAAEPGSGARRSRNQIAARSSWPCRSRAGRPRHKVSAPLVGALAPAMPTGEGRHEAYPYVVIESHLEGLRLEGLRGPQPHSYSTYVEVPS